MAELKNYARMRNPRALIWHTILSLQKPTNEELEKRKERSKEYEICTAPKNG
jgi:hypothetical protein